MADANEHFLSVEGWAEAAATVGFEPLRPVADARAFRIHVKDHRMRDVPPTLEVYFDGFVLSQAERDAVEALRLASELYGNDPSEVSVRGHTARLYELGPEPDPDDDDPRSPAVVTWAEGGRFVLLASDSMEALDLLEVAFSLYSAR
ncbi:MAG: hypothetical protein WAL25_16220 [Acidimicrobiia bacterium]